MYFRAASSELTPSNCKVYSSARHESRISSSSVKETLGLGAGKGLASGFAGAGAATTSAGLASVVGADDTAEELDIATGCSCTSATGVAVCIKGADGSLLAADT